MTTSLSKLAALITRLAAKTNADELDWSETHKGVFATTVGGTVITVSVEYSDFDPEADPDFHVQFSEHGEIVDTVSDTELQKYLPGSYATMRDLYAGARRFARGVGKLADRLTAELDDEKAQP